MIVIEWSALYYHCFSFILFNARAKQVGPVLKLVLCPLIFAVLILWPVVGIVATIIGGAAYGFLSPVFATFDAVGEGKENEFYHTIYVCTPLFCFMNPPGPRLKRSKKITCIQKFYTNIGISLSNIL